MILLCGIPTESPLALVREALDDMRAPYVFLNQRQFSVMKAVLEISDGQASGKLHVNGDSYALEDFTAIFSRMMDYRLLPELRNKPDDSLEHLFCGPGR